MANDEQLAILRRGAEPWNAWRQAHPHEPIDLAGADLRWADRTNGLLHGVDLSNADLRAANLLRADLTRATLSGATLSSANLAYACFEFAWLDGATLLEANLEEAQLQGALLEDAILRNANIEAANFRDAQLRRANLERVHGEDTILSHARLHRARLSEANLFGANLKHARLTQADLGDANLAAADLRHADLGQANLVGARLSRAKLEGADLTGARVYAASVWGVSTDDATKQAGLIISPFMQPNVTVDNLELAQFIYLLLDNTKIRSVIDTLTTKAVLILGRFTPERKAVLDAIREALRDRDYVPILFDFDMPASRDITETVTLLARMVRFIVADLTEPSSIPKELEAIVPTLAVPVQPLLEGATRPYAMFKDYWKYDWVLEPHRYENIEGLMASLSDAVIAPPERKADELARRRAAALLES